ncbi:MFS general substrate transporter [Trematosphaeria pertusa]|uniref:MFS general substrate transporter n=1 Tax=Trematosphaeria pertusa TaxID=390896 RepID=A0A6A6IKF4_9PLEO|nr:MFS general substrate transporter [Trematosphaeria pertusa]KAF2250677.1 MFS general substrate transporter [Trematosphaeria pertusa]
MSSTSSSSAFSDDTSTLKASDERTPLLAAVESTPIAEAVDASAQEDHQVTQADEDAPLPRAQIFLLCYTRVVEPIAFFAIFPYINSMIEKVGGVDKEDVGFYSGLIESLFSATQMCVMIFWGKASDRFGRKPVLSLSLFGVTFATALFGLSQSIWQMILFRCLAGVFAGTIVTVRTMITENSTKKTQARAFSYFAFAGNLGIFTGPLIGGALERPAEKFKSIFGRVRFFRDYPYALPGFTCALIGLSAAVLTTLFVKETLHIHRDKKSDEPPMSTWELIKHPGIPQVIAIYNYAMLLAFAFTAVYPVFMYTPVYLGGIGFPPELIAAFMGLGGASQALWLLLAFPPLHSRIGTGGILRLCSWVWPLMFMVDPICNVFLRYNLKISFWILFPTGMVLGSGVAMAFTAVQLTINDMAPSHETFGTLNAIVLALQSGLRAIVPAVSTSIYATGVRYHIAGGQLFWILLILVAFGLIFLLRILPEKAEGRPQREDNGQA